MQAQEIMSVAVPFEATLIPGRRNGGFVLLMPDNRLMSKNSTQRGKAFYVCKEKKSQSCKTSATVDLTTNMVVKYGPEHNHDSDLSRKVVEEAIDATVKNAADNDMIKPRVAYKNLTFSLQQAGNR